MSVIQSFENANIVAHARIEQVKLYLYSSISQMCIMGLYSLYSIWHPLSLDPGMEEEEK